MAPARRRTQAQQPSDSSFVDLARRASMPEQSSTPSPRQPQGRAPIRLTAQVLTCVAFSLVALAIIFIAQEAPLAVLAGPMGRGSQLLFGLGLSALAALGSYASFRLTSQSEATRNTITAYGRLDLSGLNPLWISLAAAIGEELLFRAALQPLLGVWITSLVFLLTHTPVYQFRKLNRATLVQAAGVFGASVALGFIYQYVGLLAAMLVHTALDVVGLYVVRNVLRAGRT
jgi:membrane protease YdiL (CAAX protease family)